MTPPHTHTPTHPHRYHYEEFAVGVAATPVIPKVVGAKKGPVGKKSTAKPSGTPDPNATQPNGAGRPSANTRANRAKN